MRRLILTAVLLVFFTAFAFSQRRLAVLPFTGGSEGEGIAIATIFSMEPEILNAFTVLPRTPALNAIFAERQFQLRGLTNADTLAEMGRLLNAEYVLSGSLRHMGYRNILFVTIISVERLQQVAGAFLLYDRIDEVRNSLSSMAHDMVHSASLDTQALPNLAILPLCITGISEYDVETLTMILATEFLNVGDFAILPRTSAIQSAFTERKIQGRGAAIGLTSSEGWALLDAGFNAQFALSIGALRLGSVKMFTAQILDVEDGSLLIGETKDFHEVSDAIQLMTEIAARLVNPKAERLREIERQRERAAAEASWYINQGNGHFSRGNLSMAERYFIEASRIYPNHSVALRKLREVRRLREIEQQRQRVEAEAARHVNSGDGYLRRREFVQAIVAFDAALRTVPNHPEATRRRAEAARQKARAEAEKLVRVHIKRGNDYLSRNRFLRSITAFEAAQEIVPEHAVVAQRLKYAKGRREEHFRPRLSSAGFSVGTSFHTAPLTLTEPLLIGSVKATFAPFRFSFLRIGCDFGFMSGVEGVDYVSIQPFIHVAGFLPFGGGRGWGGLYIGVGGGFLMEEYRLSGLTVSRGWPPDFATGIITMDFIVGLILRNQIHLSYTMRMNMFDMTNVVQNKISIGWILRFPHSIYYQRSR